MPVPGFIEMKAEDSFCKSEDQLIKLFVFVSHVTYIFKSLPDICNFFKRQVTDRL